MLKGASFEQTHETEAQKDAKLTLSELKTKKEGELKKEEWELEQIESDEHGDDFIIQTEKAKEKADNALQADMLDFLDASKHSMLGYREKLARIGVMKLDSVEFSKGWTYRCLPTSEGQQIHIGNKTFNSKAGIVVTLTSPDRKNFVRAMTLTYNPEVDHGALTTMVLQAENTYDKYRGLILTQNNLPGQTTASDYIKKASGLYTKNN